MNDEFDFGAPKRPEDENAPETTPPAAEPADPAAPPSDAVAPAGTPAADAPQAAPPSDTVAPAGTPATDAPQTAPPSDTSMPFGEGPVKDVYQNPFAPAPPSGHAPNSYRQPPYPPAAGQTPNAPNVPYGGPVYPGQTPNAQNVPYGGPVYPGQAPNAQNVPYGGPVYPGQAPNAQNVPYGGPAYPGQAPNAQNVPYGYPQWYAQPLQNGFVPPVPPSDDSSPYAPGGPSPRTPNARKQAGRIALWVVAAILEAVIVGFAVYGIYALCTERGGGSSTQRPGYGQQMPGQDQDSASSGGASSSANYTNVQMGITCMEMPAATAEKYELDQGLIVAQINRDSNAKDTELGVNDVITHANGQRVTTFDELFKLLDTMSPGDEITLTAYHVTSSGDSLQQGDSFTVTFAVQEKHEEAASSYPEL